MLRRVRKVFGAILLLSSCLGLLGLPGDIPTWYRCVRFGGTHCPNTLRISMPTVGGSLLLNVALLLVGVFLLIPQSWWKKLPILSGRRRISGEEEDEVLWLIPPGFADQIADMQRERRGEKFRLVQDDRGIKEYTRGEIDKLSSTQREKLLQGDPEMTAWWRGKSLISSAWPLFRARGGVWISKDQLDAMKEDERLKVFEGVEGLLDWYLSGRRF